MSYLNERENLLLVLEGKQPEWVPNFGRASAWIESPAVARVPDAKTGFTVDAFGVEFTETIDGHMPAHTTTGVYRLTDVTKWRDIMPTIDLAAIDWEEDSRRAMQNAAAMYGTKSTGERASNYVAGFLWDELHYLLGFEEALCALISEPEACYDFLQAAADYWIDAFRRQCKYMKPDLAMVIDHVANATGMLMSPKCYREIIKPAEKKVFDAIRQEGVRAEIHVDGLISDILPDLAEMGVSVIQPFQIFNDIEQAKRDYGMVCVGGWDAFGPGNLPDSTEEDVRQSVRTAMDAYAPSGRYAFWCSGATPRHPERLRWIEDEAERYGHSFYK